MAIGQHFWTPITIKVYLGLEQVVYLIACIFIYLTPSVRLIVCNNSVLLSFNFFFGNYTRSQ